MQVNVTLSGSGKESVETRTGPIWTIGVARLSKIEVWWLRGELQLAIRNVLSDGQPEDVVPCGLGRNVAGLATDHDYQFDLVIAVLRSQLDVRVRADDAARELGEGQRLLG